MKTLMIATVLASASATAVECDFNFAGELQLQSNELFITTDAKQSIHINEQHQLFIDNQLQALSPNQQDLVQEYYQQINTIAPATADIAIDAIDVARNGVTLAFDELMGANNDASREIEQSLSELQLTLTKSFYSEDGSIQFNSMQFEDTGSKFNSELEQRIEKVVQKSVGSLMIAMGKEMLFSGGDMQEFEQRMENFGQNVERQIETSVNQIESRAEQLCYQLQQLDATEQNIQHAIPQLAKLNMLEVQQSSAKQM